MREAGKAGLETPAGGGSRGEASKRARMENDHGAVWGSDHASGARTVCPAAEASSSAPESTAADPLSNLDALSTVAALTKPPAAEGDAYHCP